MKWRWKGAFWSLSLIFSACANVRAPSGGPSDIRPPYLVAWRSSIDKKGRLLYKIRWDEFLDMSGEVLPTLAWLNPSPSDSLPELWRRIRGKTLLLRVPASCPPGMLWLGSAIRDFTEKNPLSPMPVIPDTQARIVRLTPPPSGKYPTWLLVRASNGIYRFLAEGDSFRIAHMSEPVSSAYAFEDVNGNALWDGATEPVWLQEEEDTVLHPRWVRLILDTFPPRPKRSLTWDSQTLLTFSEPVHAEGSFIPLAENALLVTDTTLVIYDSLSYAYHWKKPETLPGDSTPAESPLFWSWSSNSQSPWIYLSMPDTGIRPDTFLHLREGQRDLLWPLCQEGHWLLLPPWSDFKEASLVRNNSQPERLPLRKAPVILRGDTLRPPVFFRLYPPPLLGNASPFVVPANDTLWLIPGHYRFAPADRASPRILIEGRWPRLVGSPQITLEITVQPSDSLQVFYFTSPRP